MAPGPVRPVSEKHREPIRWDLVRQYRLANRDGGGQYPAIAADGQAGLSGHLDLRSPQLLQAEAGCPLRVRDQRYAQTLFHHSLSRVQPARANSANTDFLPATVRARRRNPTVGAGSGGGVQLGFGPVRAMATWSGRRPSRSHPIGGALRRGRRALAAARCTAGRKGRISSVGPLSPGIVTWRRFLGVLRSPSVSKPAGLNWLWNSLGPL
jgi:hypothetical protein